MCLFPITQSATSESDSRGFHADFVNHLEGLLHMQWHPPSSQASIAGKDGTPRPAMGLGGFLLVFKLKYKTLPFKW